MLINGSFFDTQFDATWTLNKRQICDYELIVNQGFLPLNGFLSAIEYYNVLHNMRLNDDIICPIPIYLDVSNATAEKLFINGKLLLQDEYSNPLGYLLINSLWTPDKEEEAICVYGTTDSTHPGVNYLYEHTEPVYVGGQLHAYALPKH